MPPLIHDRYVAHGTDGAWDLATGDVIASRDLEARASIGVAPIAALVDVLDHGREGIPRWVVADVPRGQRLAGALSRAVADAAARGYVPVAVDVYTAHRAALAEPLRDRTLLLIALPTTPMAKARAALVAAAESCPRPHVLLTLRADRPAIADAGSRGAAVVREARAVYGAMASSLPHTARISADVARHLSRAARAGEFLRNGCHAAAERLLREVAGSVRRRQAPDAEAQVLLMLGAVLLERGRVSDADGILRDAARAADLARDPVVVTDARIWQALARIEGGQLTAAESICRGLLVAGVITPGQRCLVSATLARVLLSQGRAEEATELDLAWPEDAPSGTRRAMVDDLAVRVSIARDDLFGAGQRAREAVTRCVGMREGESTVSADLPGLASAIANRARLRVVAAAGDLVAAEAAFAEAVAAANDARAPLHVARAYLVWGHALARAGRARDLARVCHVLRRMRRAATPRLRTAIDRLVDAGAQPSRARVAMPSQADVARVFMEISHEREDDRDAVEATLRWTIARLQAARIDLWSCDAGPASVIVTAGCGMPTALGPRVLDAGIAIGPELPDAREIAVPVRLGPSLLAAIAARWPADRVPPAQAVGILDLAAAVSAPRIHRMQAIAREAAQTVTAMPELIGVSEGIAAVRKAVARAAAAPFSVLIEGESGAGKELVARAIHQLSARRERRFCDINCAALPDDLLDAELFGHARGAFTGAVGDRPGLFEDADGGTLFLDELADLSPRAQAKLLRVLQQHEVRRIGESFARKVDVRIVAAANRDMREEAGAGRFRQDLLYRLDVIRIRIPPLRERPADISVLAAHFWREASARVGSTATLSHGVLAALSAYAWPGNVRELQNVIAALAVAAPARGRVPASLLPPVLAGSSSIAGTTLADARAQFERRFIEAAVARAGGRRARAARDLGLSRQGLLKLMIRLGMPQKDGAAAASRSDD